MNKIKQSINKIEIIWNMGRKEKKLYEYLYLIVFAMYLLEAFVSTTKFPSLWTNNFHLLLHVVLVLIVMFRFITIEGMSFKHSIIMSLVVMSFMFTWNYTGRDIYDILFDVTFLCIGAYAIDYKRILKTYLLVEIPATIVTIIASQADMVTNLIYNQDGRIRESFGFVYPTDFAAHIFFIFMAWALVRQFRCTLWELIFMIVIVAILNIKSDTRCSEISILLIVITVLFFKYKKYWIKKQNNNSYIKRLFKVCCLSVPLVFSTAMIFLCRFYSEDNKLMYFLNKVLSERLRLGKKTFDYYDVSLLGQVIIMDGNGGSLEKPADYTFIDCSYINILMRFGLIAFGVVLLMVEVVMLKNLNNTYLLTMVVIVCIASMIEHHLIEYYYNFFIILPLASFRSIQINSPNKKFCIKQLLKTRDIHQ